MTKDEYECLAGVSHGLVKLVERAMTLLAQAEHQHQFGYSLDGDYKTLLADVGDAQRAREFKIMSRLLNKLRLEGPLDETKMHTFSHGSPQTLERAGLAKSFTEDFVAVLKDRNRTGSRTVWELTTLGQEVVDYQQRGELTEAQFEAIKQKVDKADSATDLITALREELEKKGKV